MSVLIYFDRPDYSLDDVARLCHVQAGGYCRWDESVYEIGSQFELDDLSENWPAIVAAVEDGATPVIATIANPYRLLTGDHAVVVIGISGKRPTDRVTFMDPETGSIRTSDMARFRLWWDTSGERAFMFRP